MIVSIHVDDAMTNNELVDFLDNYDWELVSRRATFLETVFECRPGSGGHEYTADDIAHEMEAWLDVSTRVLDVEY